jgi:hypothetical protein
MKNILFVMACLCGIDNMIIPDDLVIYSLPSLSSQFNYLLIEPCQIYLWYIGFIVTC